MIEPIEGMPEGTQGLRAEGRLSREDYTDVLQPVLEEAAAGGGIRLVFLLTDFHGLEHGAWVEDAKTGMHAWIKQHSAWKRFALVTDVEWVARAMRAFSWLAPGEVRTFEPGELEAAKKWVAG